MLIYTNWTYYVDHYVVIIVTLIQFYLHLISNTREINGGAGVRWMVQPNLLFSYTPSFLPFILSIVKSSDLRISIMSKNWRMDLEDSTQMDLEDPILDPLRELHTTTPRQQMMGKKIVYTNKSKLFVSNFFFSPCPWTCALFPMNRV